MLQRTQTVGDLAERREHGLPVHAERGLVRIDGRAPLRLQGAPVKDRGRDRARDGGQDARGRNWTADELDDQGRRECS